MNTICSIVPILVSLLLFTSESEQTINDATIESLYQWTFPDYLYPSQQARTVALGQRLFIPQNAAILDSDYYFNPKTAIKRVFVTTPQFGTGIPATVSEVSRQTNERGEYLLQPFPNWDSIGTASCEFAISVYRIHIDRCGLMWVLDTGRVNTFTSPSRACRPKLLVYDLNNGDTLLERFEFPDGTITNQSNLITLVTESYQEDCRDSIAYIADVNGYGLVVFDLPRRNSWRVTHNFFYPDPVHGTMTVAGVTFDLMDGIFGLALGPGNAQNRRLYFHSLASFGESSALVSVLKNTTITSSSDLIRNRIELADEARPGQSTLEVMTDDGILLFTLLPQTAIACWNSKNKFSKENIHIVYQDPEKLQFMSGMKLKGGKRLLITSSRLQNYIAGNLDYPGIKYRVILIDDVQKLLQGSPCMKVGPASGASGSNSGSFGSTNPNKWQKPNNRPVWQTNY